MNPLVPPLGAIDASMVGLVGGKAANLGELTRAGMPVPAGFCLTVDAYRAVADAAGLDPIVERLDRLSDGASNQAGQAERAALAEKARLAVAEAPVPEEVAAQLVAAYRALGGDEVDVPVAVRSSATAEDLPFASFAGQQDTYLNVIGVGAMLNAVRRCWASLWTERAVSYRATNGIPHRDVALAVVVQRMVNAQVSGVVFTANPVTGRRREAVIDASPGLGEAVVSGAVNPDRFVVGLDGRPVRERRLGDKRVVVLPVAGGGVRRLERPATPNEPATPHEPAGPNEPARPSELVACLTDERVRELAQLGRRVEEHYGTPRDCEWALDEAGVLWLTQARPITTLYPLPTEAVASDEGSATASVYFCASLAQGLVRPITPMGLSVARVLGSGVAELFGVAVPDPLRGPRRLVIAGQRPFVDVTPALTHPVGRRVMLGVFGVMEARAATVLRELGDDPRFAVRPVSVWPLVLAAGRAMWRLRMPPKLVEALVSPRRARRRVERFEAPLRSRLAPPGPATAEQRLDHVERVVRTELSRAMPHNFPTAGAGFLMLGLASWLVRGLAEPGALQVAMRGLPHNVTTEMDLRLWALARRIHANPASAAALRDRPAAELATAYRRGELPGVAQAGLARFLSWYGHRAVAEIDLGLPRWWEDPAHLLGVLANYLRLANPEQGPDAQFARAQASAEQAVRRIVEAARWRGRWRGRLVGFALRRARELAGLREMPKYYLVVGLDVIRRQLAELGGELAAVGRLDAGDDVFWLTLAEVRAALRGTDQRRVVSARRVEYERELRRRHVPRLLLSDGTEPEAVIAARAARDAAARAAAGQEMAGRLDGVPASAGTVTGVARVVLDPVGAYLEPGEILVAPSTDPGWTPLFLTAGGLVMEMGGANSHGAVVAREYGIPAVVGVPGATLRIRDGQRIEVRGGEGCVITS